MSYLRVIPPAGPADFGTGDASLPWDRLGARVRATALLAATLRLARENFTGSIAAHGELLERSARTARSGPGTAGEVDAGGATA